MSLPGLFDSIIRAVRPATTETVRAGTLATWVETVAAPSAPNARVTRYTGTLGTRPAGEQSEATFIVSMDPGADVIERDVIEITAGAEAGLLLRVISAAKPVAGVPLTAHHRKLTCVRFFGVIQ